MLDQTNPPGEHVSNDDASSIPGSLKSYIATRSDDPGRAVAGLIRRYARTALWTVITAPIEASLHMEPCSIGAHLLLRRTEGMVCAAIVSPNWSISLRGDEAWIDIQATHALAVAYIGKPIGTAFDIPFLSTELIVRGSMPLGSYHRFHCYA